MIHDPAATPTPEFPRLTPTNHRITSPATRDYNCIGWAVGETVRWGSPASTGRCRSILMPMELPT